MHFLHTSLENKDHCKYLSQGCSSDCLDSHHQTYILDVLLLKHNDSTQLLSKKTMMLFFFCWRFLTFQCHILFMDYRCQHIIVLVLTLKIQWTKKHSYPYTVLFKGSNKSFISSNIKISRTNTLICASWSFSCLSQSAAAIVHSV